MPGLTAHQSRMCHLKHVDKGRERERTMAGARMERPTPTCDCIPALFHEITVVADAGQTGSSCFARRSPVTRAGRACAPGMG